MKTLSAKQKDTVKKLLAKGFSYNRIAKTIQKTSPPVRNVVKKTKPKRVTKPWTEEDKNKLEALYQAGHSHSEIAKELGRSTRSVYMKLYHQGMIKGKDFEYLGLLNWAKKAKAKIVISFD